MLTVLSKANTRKKKNVSISHPGELIMCELRLTTAVIFVNTITTARTTLTFIVYTMKIKPISKMFYVYINFVRTGKIKTW